MTNSRRLKSDMATVDKREVADKATVHSRNKNDLLTQERRFQADKTLENNRARNDEITSDRRITKDWANQDMALAISLIVIALAIVAFFIFL